MRLSLVLVAALSLLAASLTSAMKFMCDMCESNWLHCIMKCHMEEYMTRHSYNKLAKAMYGLCAMKDEVGILEILRTEAGVRAAAYFNLEFGENLLHCAAMKGLVSVAEGILEAVGPRVWSELASQRNSISKQTPLHCAASYDEAAFVEFLLQAAAETGGRDGIWTAVIARNDYGQTPLHQAARKGNLSVVEALISMKEGRDTITEGDQLGLTPLHWASHMGHTAVVERLLRTRQGRRALGIENIFEETPWDEAEEEGHAAVLEVIGALSEPGGPEAPHPDLVCAVCLSAFSANEEDEADFLVPVTVCTNGHCFCLGCALRFGRLCPYCRMPCFDDPVVDTAMCEAVRDFNRQQTEGNND